MTKWLNIVLLTLLLVVGLPVYWLFLDTSPWNVAAKPLDIAEVRRLAESMPGPKAVRIDFAVPACNAFPSDVMAAGSGLKRRSNCAIAYRLEVPGHGPVMIDSGVTPAFARSAGMSFDPRIQGVIDRNLERAGLVLLTHEHPDHIGGLAALAGKPGGLGVASRAKLNSAQLPSATSAYKLDWPVGLVLRANLSSAAPQAVAPGIVVIPAPGHSPGSQLIYVRLASGREYIFAGDTATMAVSWRELRPRSRFVSDYYSPEDRRAVIGWLHALHKLNRAHPKITIVPGHDFDWMISPDSRSGMDNFAAKLVNNRAGS